jgi:uncharacterized protein
VRVFFDTNVIVSALVARGLCADLLRLVLADHELIVGEVVIAETRKVVSEKLGASAELVQELERLLREHTLVPRPAEACEVMVGDPDDAWVLASAIAGEADVLVTGDRDLLVIAEAAPIPIWTPRRLWEHLRLEPPTDPPS